MDKSYLDGWVMLICNPVAGTGRGAERLATCRRLLDRAGVRYASATTLGHGDAARLARSAVASGCSGIVVIGGDGTFFEAVNGIMPREPHEGIVSPVAVGLIQAGRGSDFGRSAGLPTDVEAACARLLSGRTETIDLGHVSYLAFNNGSSGSGGRSIQGRYFVNAAGLGFDAEVAQRANSGPRVMGGSVTYLGSLLATFGTYRNKRMQLHVDGSPRWKDRANSIVIANGQFFGGGMKIAPEARLSDGEFSVVIIGNLGKLDLIGNLPRVYDGSHASHPKVRMLCGQVIEVTSPDRLLLQADGEVLGTAPARFMVVPGALRLIV